MGSIQRNNRGEIRAVGLSAMLIGTRTKWRRCSPEVPGSCSLQVEVSPAGDAGMDSTGEGGSGDDTQSGPVIVSDEAMLVK